MNGLTDEQRKRLSLITNLEEDQKDYLLAGILGVLDAWQGYTVVTNTHREVSNELLNDIDAMIAKAYEKGRYV